MTARCKCAMGVFSPPVCVHVFKQQTSVHLDNMNDVAIAIAVKSFILTKPKLDWFCWNSCAVGKFACESFDASIGAISQSNSNKIDIVLSLLNVLCGHFHTHTHKQTYKKQHQPIFIWFLFRRLFSQDIQLFGYCYDLLTVCCCASACASVFVQVSVYSDKNNQVLSKLNRCLKALKRFVIDFRVYVRWNKFNGLN